MDICNIHSFWPSVLFSSIFGVFLFTIEFIGPLIILTYCYGRIVWVLTRRMDSKLETISTRADTFQLARKNTLKTFFMISICFVVCWSCEQGFYFMYNIGFNVDFNGTFYHISILMAFINCTINPFIYLIKNKDYQQALKQCLNYTRPTTNNEGIKHSSIFSTSTMSVSWNWVFLNIFTTSFYNSINKTKVTERIFLNWPKFMLQWFIGFPEFAEFTEFLFHLRKAPILLSPRKSLYLVTHVDKVNCPIFRTLITD